jgi:hypothetical protein
VSNISREREAWAWSIMFDAGHDYFGTLTEIGASAADARAAWERSGATWLAYWRPQPGEDEEPWAWREFGPPPGWQGPLPAPVSKQEARELSAKLWLAAGETPAWMRGS